ncbi:hypothetical protein CYMTET_19210, partial [Cymbomonas tetramitiformis]
LVASFTSCQVLVKGIDSCNDSDTENDTGCHAYISIQQTAVVACVLIAVELFVLREPAEVLLRNALSQIFEEFSDTIESFFGLYVTDPTAMDNAIHSQAKYKLSNQLGDLRGLIQEVKGHFDGAQKEPTLWNNPFPGNGYAGVIKHSENILDSLEIMLNAFDHAFRDYKREPSGYHDLGSSSEVLMNPLLIYDQLLLDSYTDLRHKIKHACLALKTTFQENAISDSKMNVLSEVFRLTRRMDDQYTTVIKKSTATGIVRHSSSKVITNHILMLNWEQLGQHFYCLEMALRGCPQDL